MSNYTVESCLVESSDGVKLHTRLFKTKEGLKDDLVIVLVHPFTVMGGYQGLLGGIASGLAENGHRVVTSDLKGAGKSTGKPTLTGFAEIKDVIAVCKWISENLSTDRILLVGSSAGCVSLGYPFYSLWKTPQAYIRITETKALCNGDRDGFTSVKQLKNKLSYAAGHRNSPN